MHEEGGLLGLEFIVGLDDNDGASPARALGEHVCLVLRDTHLDQAGDRPGRHIDLFAGEPRVRQCADEPARLMRAFGQTRTNICQRVLLCPTAACKGRAYWIRRLACFRRAGGSVRPSPAAFRLTVSSIFEGASIGSSAACAPFSRRSA